MFIATTEVQVLVQVQEMAYVTMNILFEVLFQIENFLQQPNVPVTSQMKDKNIDDCETVLRLYPDSKPQHVMHSKAGFQEMKVSHRDNWKPSITTEW